MEIRVSMVVESLESTLSALYIDDVFECWVLEDAKRDKKVEGKTCIPPGRYPLEVRKDSPMANRYDEKFKRHQHRGMLWLRGVPNFKWVYFHIGNDVEDTEGCLLVGDGVKREGFGVASAVTHSTYAYLRIYPIIMAAIEQGDEVFVDIDRTMKKCEKQSYIDGFVRGSKASLDLIREFTDILEDKGVNLAGVAKEMALDMWKKDKES